MAPFIILIMFFPFIGWFLILKNANEDVNYKLVEKKKEEITDIKKAS